MRQTTELNRITHSLLFTLACFFLCRDVASAEEIASGFTSPVVSNHVLVLKGKPYHGIGVNYFSLASRLLQNPQDTSSLTNLAALSKAKIPFVRFMCGGFWPVEQNLYITNREVFFQRLDRVFRCAEENQIGLVPSLFWYLPTISDLVGEPFQELGNTNSRSIAFIRSYTKDLVSRYRKSPALWAWEFGNEGNLLVDLPNAVTQRPSIVPGLGTADHRTEKDELRFSDLRTAYLEFARTVQSLEPRRLVLSGNAIPRPSAWHNSYQHSWTPDTPEQFGEILRRDNPAPMNGISVHIYPAEIFPAGMRSASDMLKLTARECIDAGKPLFLGEFGVKRSQGSFDQQKEQFAKLLSAIEEARVPMSAVWVFDLPMQDADWNITFENSRTIFLKMISQANQRLQK